MTVHSTQLAAGATAGPSETLVYTVPSGTRVILKSIVVTNAHNAVNRTYLVGTVGGSDTWSVVMYPAAASSSGENVIVNCWIVLNAGDEIKMGSASSSFSYVLSGAVLNL